MDSGKIKLVAVAIVMYVMQGVTSAQAQEPVQVMTLKECME